MPLPSIGIRLPFDPTGFPINNTMQEPTINSAVFNGICKTINRFRENPFLYFTESDIHSSLSKDILEGNSELLIMGKSDRSIVKVPVSLVHHEYPTNFRYEKKRLKGDGYKDAERKFTDLNGQHGRRGHFDLAILNNAFVADQFRQHQNNLMLAIEHIFNKDISNATTRETVRELLFAIEVKFIQPFNALHKAMLDEVTADNNKLDLALYASDKFVMPINLVFCNSNYIQSNGNSVIDRIKEYLQDKTHAGICSIFVQSHYHAPTAKAPNGDHKETRKPIFTFKPIPGGSDWAAELAQTLFKAVPHRSSICRPKAR